VIRQREREERENEERATMCNSKILFYQDSDCTAACPVMKGTHRLQNMYTRRHGKDKLPHNRTIAGQNPGTGTFPI
jgi:hypothetical protein